MGTQIYLVHVHFNHWRKVGARFVVAKEGTLESLLIQETHWMGFERIIFVGHTNKYSNTPSLQSKQNVKNVKHINSVILFLTFNDWKEFIENYIMDTFKGRNHGINTSSALDTSINSSVGHLSYHLKTWNQI